MAVYIGRLLELLSDLFVQAFVNPWQMTQAIVFHSNPGTPTNRQPKRKRRSIVRMIGSNLPLPSAQRVYLNLAAWNSCAHSYTSSIAIQEQISKQDQCEINTDGVTETDGNGDTKAAIKSLQEELKQLRMQITAILENQSNTVKDGFKDVNLLTDSEDELRPRNKLSAPPSPPPMPPAPPPPPPLPPAALNVSQSIPIMKKKSSVSKQYGCNKNTPPSAMHILGQVLSEMKNGRPKLRPVQRSPGGRPLKAIRPKTDPSDVLTEVLKRRFSVAQMSDTNESSDTSHTDTASGSPDWRTCVT